MNLDIQSKLNEDKKYHNYLRENPSWYKILNRNPERFNDFINEMKDKYKLRTTDRISNITDRINLISMFLNMLK